MVNNLNFRALYIEALLCHYHPLSILRNVLSNRSLSNFKGKKCSVLHFILNKVYDKVYNGKIKKNVRANL
jgi:hypothetical protein